MINKHKEANKHWSKHLRKCYGMLNFFSLNIFIIYDANTIISLFDLIHF